MFFTMVGTVFGNMTYIRFAIIYIAFEKKYESYSGYDAFKTLRYYNIEFCRIIRRCWWNVGSDFFCHVKLYAKLKDDRHVPVRKVRKRLSELDVFFFNFLSSRTLRRCII